MKTSEIDDRILSFLEHGPTTPDEIATGLHVAWGTAQGHLLKLVGTGKVSVVRKGRVNVYSLSSPLRLKPDVPTWVRAKSLQELSEELQPYFDKKISSADMIRKERRNA